MLPRKPTVNGSTTRSQFRLVRPTAFVRMTIWPVPSTSGQLCDAGWGPSHPSEGPLVFLSDSRDGSRSVPEPSERIDVFTPTVDGIHREQCPSSYCLSWQQS